MADNPNSNKPGSSNAYRNKTCSKSANHNTPGSNNPSLRRFLSSRRDFLKKAGLLSGAGLILPSASYSYITGADRGASDQKPLDGKLPDIDRNPSPGHIIRIRGRVTAGGRGIRGISITDGLRIIETGQDGEFELLSDDRRLFVYLSLPAGYRIPTNPTGTARFYQKIEPDQNGEMRAVFELETDPADRTRHAFLMLADPQTENEYEVRRFHSETVPDIRKLIHDFGDGRPLFGIGGGDLMFDNLELFPEYEKAVHQMGVPFFQLIGNHDITFRVRSAEDAYRVFQEYFGPTHYSFDAGEIHYVILNNIFWYGTGYVGYLDQDQLDWLEADLARIEKGRTVVVSMHIPALSTQHLRLGSNSPSPRLSLANRDALYHILEPYNVHLLTAHMHEHDHVFEGGLHEHIHGTVCGAWWTGPICFDGTPNGYGLYEARGSELRWQYKATGYVADFQIKLYKRGADPEKPGEILANVWDWDPEWSVFWYENGERRGQMTRRTSLDPLAVELFDGPDKPERRTWINPVPTSHLFYAPLDENAGPVTVEAINRWGKTFTARLA